MEFQKFEVVSEVAAFMKMAGYGSEDAIEWFYEGSMVVRLDFASETLYYTPMAKFPYEFQVVYHYLTGVATNYKKLFSQGLVELAENK